MAYCKNNCVFEFSVFILNQKEGTMLLLIWYSLVIWKRPRAKEVAQHYSEVFPDSCSRKSTIAESVVYKHLLACLAFHVIVEIQFSISLSHLVVHWEMVYVRIPRQGQTRPASSIMSMPIFIPVIIRRSNWTSDMLQFIQHTRSIYWLCTCQNIQGVFFPP